jgi:hypothetical protein
LRFADHQHLGNAAGSCVAHFLSPQTKSGWLTLISNVAHRTLAFWGAAAARTGAAEAVIDGEFFAGADFAEAIKEDLAAEAAHGEIRIAAMIDDLGAAPTDGAIELKALIQAYGVDALGGPCRERPDGAAHGFSLADAFTGVLDDPPAPRDSFF